jgi:hypothetical protein
MLNEPHQPVSNFEQTGSGIIGKNEPMLAGYRFVIHSDDDTESLGTMALGDDDEARLFGAEVIRDLMQNAPTRYAAYTMDIVHGERAVASIPFAPAG